jgi:hypothetical protein
MRVKAQLHDFFEPGFEVAAVEDATHEPRHGMTLVNAPAVNRQFSAHVVWSTDEAVARMRFGMP